MTREMFVHAHTLDKQMSKNFEKIHYFSDWRKSQIFYVKGGYFG